MSGQNTGLAAAVAREKGLVTAGRMPSSAPENTSGFVAERISILRTSIGILEHENTRLNPIVYRTQNAIARRAALKRRAEIVQLLSMARRTVSALELLRARARDTAATAPVRRVREFVRARTTAVAQRDEPPPLEPVPVCVKNDSSVERGRALERTSASARPRSLSRERNVVACAHATQVSVEERFNERARKILDLASERRRDYPFSTGGTRVSVTWGPQRLNSERHANRLAEAVSQSARVREIADTDAFYANVSVSTDYLRATAGLYFTAPSAIDADNVVFISEKLEQTTYTGVPKDMQLLGPGQILTWRDVKCDGKWMPQLCVREITSSAVRALDEVEQFVELVLSAASTRGNSFYVYRTPAGHDMTVPEHCAAPNGTLVYQKIHFADTYTHKLVVFDVEIGTGDDAKLGALLVWARV